MFVICWQQIGFDFDFKLGITFTFLPLCLDITGHFAKTVNSQDLSTIFGRKSKANKWILSQFEPIGNTKDILCKMELKRSSYQSLHWFHINNGNIPRKADKGATKCKHSPWSTECKMLLWLADKSQTNLWAFGQLFHQHHTDTWWYINLVLHVINN